VTILASVSNFVLVQIEVRGGFLPLLSSVASSQRRNAGKRHRHPKRATDGKISIARVIKVSSLLSIGAGSPKHEMAGFSGR
jgi:hypothetical protein